jgi:hypothetical protein
MYAARDGKKDGKRYGSTFIRGIEPQASFFFEVSELFRGFI